MTGLTTVVHSSLPWMAKELILGMPVEWGDTECMPTFQSDIWAWAMTAYVRIIMPDQCHLNLSPFLLRNCSRATILIPATVHRIHWFSLLQTMYCPSFQVRPLWNEVSLTRCGSYYSTVGGVTQQRGRRLTSCSSYCGHEFFKVAGNA